MKKIILLGTLLLGSILQAQIYNYAYVDKLPTFEECMSNENYDYECFIVKMQEKIRKQMPEYKHRIGKINGQVDVTFVVEKDGKITVGTCHGDNRLVKYAIKMMENLKDIIPAEKNNEKVAVQLETTIIFNWKNL